ncbi:hypothetical protein [Uliginosibacterium gangwonense]|uniref:hypothetical protein n=1 Tax=Uliginosibacterium gangwonense TaxID=392736 RepID=UPI00037CBF92|nr:hypothetical protein [Uliginosibacterium gangwonense]
MNTPTPNAVSVHSFKRRLGVLITIAGGLLLLDQALSTFATDQAPQASQQTVVPAPASVPMAAPGKRLIEA